MLFLPVGNITNLLLHLFVGEESKLNIAYFSFSKFGIWVLHEQRDVHRLDKYYVTLFSGRLGSSNQERKGMKIFAPLAATSSREAESDKGPALSAIVPRFSIVAKVGNLCKLLSSHSSHIFF